MGEEYYLQHPRNQKFYYVLTLIMSFTSLGDRSLMGYVKPPRLSFINSKILHYIGPLCAISQLFYLYINFNDLSFDDIAVFFSIFPAALLANVDIASAKLESYKRLLKMLFFDIHLYTVYEENKEEFIKKTLIKTERYIRWTTGYLVIFFFASWLMWICLTTVNNFYNKEQVLNHTFRLQTCVYLWLPFDYSYNFRYWYIVHAINVYIVGAGVTVMAVFQSLNNIFIYNVTGHIRILKNKIKTDFDRNLSDVEVHEKLVEIVEYHTFIIRVFKEIQYAFGINVIANYAQNLAASSVVLYQVVYGARENMFLYIPMIMAYTGGPILMSLVLEEVKKQADDLPEVVYDIPWEKMSISNQKIVSLILQRVQIVFEFEALGILRAGVKPMTSILKTTFSYYVMLESTMSSKS